MTSLERVAPAAFRQAGGTEDWRVLGEGACAYFRTGSLAAGARLVAAIADLDDGHPDLDVRATGVTVRLVTIDPDYYGLTGREVELARRISAAARELGMVADPTGLQTVQVTIDALAAPEVLPFWRAVLGYLDRGDGPEDIIDPRGRGPAFWFQRMDAPRPQRNRIHLDVWVPEEQAEGRVAAALDAGGRLVSAEAAPSFWVLADAEGNEACICTAADRA